MPHGLGYYDTALGAYLPDDPIYTCEKCGSISTDEEFLTEIHGEYWCPECLEETTDCFGCDTLFHFDDLTEENGHLYCEDCLIELRVEDE